MANRIITATVTGETIKLSNKTAGAAGSFNAVSLSLTFDSAWDGTTKKLYFFDAYGNNAVYRLLTTDLLVDGAYIVPIPAEPLAYAGEMTITIRGVDFATDGTTAERIIMSASTTMKVLSAIAPASDVAPVEPTPTQTEQLQGEIDSVKSTITNAAASATAAANSATAAATSATAAQTAQTALESARDAASNSKTAAATSESNAASSATAASTSAGNASASASAASTSASNASSSANAAASSASASASSASAADAAKTAAASSASAAATSETNAASSAQAAANSAASLVVVNDLTTGGTTKALSAEQGKVLNTSISTLATQTNASISELSTKNITSVSTKNLFNPNTITVGYYVSYADGTVVASSTYSYTDYISVAASTAYVSNKYCRMIAYYDSNKAFISGVQNISANTLFKTPSTAMFMRITLHNTDISAGSVQIENGTLTTDYEPYYVLSPNKVGANAVSGNCIKDGSLSWRKSKYLTCGKNLFNKAAATQGYYINSANGAIGTSSSFYISEYIPVTAGVTYTRNIAYGTAFYDANFQFISGIANSDITFTAPANAVYLRASITTSSIDLLQIEVGSTSTEFENFYISISPLYVNQTESIINLPSKLYGVVGHELNIYFDSIIEDASAYKINVICTNGSQYADRWTFTPTTAGTITLSIELRKNNQLIATASTSIIVVSATVGASSTRKCMFIGDSTTAAGTYTGEIQTLATADSMSVTLLGTQGTSPNSYEAYGGWNTGSFVASGSPFYISGALNFSAYMSAHGYSSVDRIVINLGINDIFAYLTDNSLASAMATAITNINSLITSIRAFSSTVPIGIAITIPPSYSQDAFAASYQSGQTRWRYKRNLILWDKLLIATFGGQETNNIYLIPIHTNLDTKNNMQTATINANARNTTQVTVQNNGVHPAPSGYYQIADAMYYWLKSLES